MVDAPPIGIAYGSRPARLAAARPRPRCELRARIVEVAGPHHLGAEELVEHDVAGRRVRTIRGQHDRAREPETVRGGRGHAYVVALPPAAGDERVGAVVERVGAQLLELAHLVATTGERGQVVALDQQAAGREAELRAQPVHRLTRRRQAAANEHSTSRSDATSWYDQQPSRLTLSCRTS